MQLPKPILEKYHSLAPASINNSRSMFLSAFKRARGSEGKELFFAEKWGLNYHGKYLGDANPQRAEELDITDEESLLLADKYNIY